MLATKLRGKITSNRKLVVEIPRDIAPGAVEVILLHDAPSKATKASRRKTAHPGFGLWAKRADLIDSSDYAAQLRQQIEQHADRHA
jgi:predicted subunit of tRNA(5-methylaminomethyl-2-thiouridylate) methyltransferase